jgi:hypothetical protein
MTISMPAMARMVALLMSVLVAGPAPLWAKSWETADWSRLEDALDAMTIPAPGKDALVLAFDHNLYVQCRHAPDSKTIRCEAAGTLMQTSLTHVLTPDRIDRLIGMGWTLAPAFGNYAQVFPANTDPEALATVIFSTLIDGYGATFDDIVVESSWIPHEACPPRNDQSQNLAGVIETSPAMAAVSLHACAYKPIVMPPQPVLDVPEPSVAASALVQTLGPGVAAELKRLRDDLANDDLFVVFGTPTGYVQCRTDEDRGAIYCEAQSSESWPALARVLTPERVARLHAEGFADPGKKQNFYREYPVDSVGDTAIARALITILRDVYGYDGANPLEIATEKTPVPWRGTTQ